MNSYQPEQTYGQTWAVRVALLIVSLLLIGMFVAIAVSEPDGRQFAAIATIVILGIWAGIAVMIGKTRIMANDFGIRRESLFGATELQWRSIREYRYKILMSNAAGHFGGIAYLIARMIERRRGKALSFVLTLLGENGEIRVTSNFRNAHELKERALTRIHGSMLPSMRASLERGQPLQFGPISLTREAVSYKRKAPVPLSEVGRIELTGPQLRIKKSGKMFDYASIPAAKIPNILAFMQIAREATERRTMTPAADKFVAI
jgi:hypothetical protein